MNELTGLRTRESLLGEIVELKRQLAEAHAVILKLSGQIEELQRAGKRQAVPFARREHVEHPKKRGRKHGKGQFKNREKPKAEEISETKKAELSGCPDCQCELENWLKQKCLSRLLKDLKELTETKVRGAVRFAREVKELLQSALTLKTQKDQLPVKQYARQAKTLEVRLDELIDAKRKLTDPDNARFAKRLRKHRKHVLRFLYVDGLDATNNLAERQLRPAVITRKTNGCNRTNEGAQSHAILGSILATCRQQAVPVLEYLIKLQKFGETPPSLTGCLSPDT